VCDHEFVNVLSYKPFEGMGKLDRLGMAIYYLRLRKGHNNISQVTYVIALN